MRWLILLIVIIAAAATQHYVDKALGIQLFQQMEYWKVYTHQMTYGIWGGVITAIYFGYFESK